MCEVCGRDRCPSGCPNAEAPPAVAECDCCHRAVRVGDVYYEKADGLLLCEGCVDHMTKRELLAHFGCSECFAEEVPAWSA